MMLSVNLKDSVLTTQSSTVYVDLKSKTKKYIMTEYEYLYKKTYVYCFFNRSQYNSRTLFFLKKKLSLLGAALNRQNFQGSYFLKWLSIAPTEYCVTYLPSGCPSWTYYNPQGSHFSQKRIGFQSTPMNYVLFSLDLVSRISEFVHVLFWSSFY